MRLVTDLGRLSHSWNTCVDVVYEGAPPPTWLDGSYVIGIRVWFSGKRSADDRLLQLINEQPPEEPCFVVTSGEALAHRARRLGAAVVTARTLERALERVCGMAMTRTAAKSPLLWGPEALVGLEASISRNSAPAHADGRA